MWLLLRSLLTKWALFRLLLKSLGSLAWLLPLAFILKAIGLPILVLLAILALPLLILLAVIGLPIILVMVVGGTLLTFTMWILSIGMVALKIALPIILVVWFVRWLRRPKSGADDVPGTATAD